MSGVGAQSSPRLARLRAEIRDDRRAFDKRIAELAKLPTDGGWDSGACAIAAVALHGGYGAIESAIERVTRSLEGDLPTSPNWHRELLHGATLEIEGVRPPIISESTERVLKQILGFRHFFRHAYAADLDFVQLQPLVKRLLEAAPALAAELDAFDLFLSLACAPV